MDDSLNKNTPPATYSNGKVRNARVSKRIEYVDLLKGVAIFLMIMGHFLSWQWGGSMNAHIPEDVKYVTIVKDFIYSFHMPLFFFLSGYVFNMSMKEWTWSVFGRSLYRRVLQLLVPGFACMIICYYVRERVYFEWFIRTLFVIYLVNAVIYFIAQKFKHKFLPTVIMQILMYAILRVLSRLTHDSVIDNDILQLEKITYYMVYFASGVFSYRYGLLKYIHRHSFLTGLSLILWVSMFMLGRNGFYVPYINYLMAYCAIIVCLYTASLLNYEKKMVMQIVKLGQYTLPLYLLSPYIIPRGTILGNYIAFFSRDGCETAIAVQLILGATISLYVCMIILGLSKILESNRITSLLFLGKQ